MPVNNPFALTAGVQYTNGAAVSTPTGTQIFGWDGTDVWAISAASLTHANALAVEIVDGNGDQITSFGGTTQYTDETAESAGAFTGTVALGYNGTDVVGLRLDASNNLYVNLHTAIPAGSNLIGQIEVSDGTNVLFTSSHSGYVQFPSAQAVTLTSTTVTGTVAVTQSTNPWIVAGGGTAGTPGTAVLTVQGIGSGTPVPVSGTITFPASPVVWTEGHAGGIFDAVVGAAAPANALLVGGSDGTDIQAVATDSSGQVKVLLENSVPAGSNLIGQVEVSDGTNVLFTSGHAGYVQFPSAQAVTLTSTTITGTVAVTQSTSPWVTKDQSDGTPGSAAPLIASQIAGYDGTNLRTVLTDASGQVKVLVENTSGIPVPVSGVSALGAFSVLYVAGSLTHNHAAPAADSQLGVLPAVASSAAPTYTTGDQVLLSTDLAGNLRAFAEVVGNAGGIFDAATNATVPANGIQTLAVASTTLPTSVTAGNTVAPLADVAGRLIVRSAGPRERCVPNGITLTASTSATSLIAAGAAGIYRDLTFLQASNSSATNCLMTITDGTLTYIWFLAANGGGFNINFDPPLKASSTATAWTAQCGSSVSSVYVSAQAVETK